MVDSNADNKGVFISYAREDHEAARRLYSELKQRGLEPWLEESLLPGQVWRDEISKAINKNSDTVSVIDGKTNTVMKNMPVGFFPRGLV